MRTREQTDTIINGPFKRGTPTRSVTPSRRQQLGLATGAAIEQCLWGGKFRKKNKKLCTKPFPKYLNGDKNKIMQQPTSKERAPTSSIKKHPLGTSAFKNINGLPVAINNMSILPLDPRESFAPSTEGSGRTPACCSSSASTARASVPALISAALPTLPSFPASPPRFPASPPRRPAPPPLRFLRSDPPSHRRLRPRRPCPPPPPPRQQPWGLCKVAFYDRKQKQKTTGVVTVTVTVTLRGRGGREGAFRKV